MKVKLQNVRLAFPNLFEPKAAKAGQDPKYSATFIFPPDHPAVKVMKDAMSKAAQEKWGEKAMDIGRQLMAANRVALHDGAEKAGQYAGYEGNMYVNSANNPRWDPRPMIIDGMRQPLAVADGKPYAGCYVNAVIDVLGMDNEHGKRIRAKLLGVQFYADGERLAGGAPASEDDFEEIPEAAVADSGAASVFGDAAHDAATEGQEEPANSDPFA